MINQHQLVDVLCSLTEDDFKQVADKWKERIDPRVYEALLNYKVEITD